MGALGGMPTTGARLWVPLFVPLVGLVAGLAAATVPIPSLAVVLALGVVAAVVIHPPLAAYILLFTTPLVVGIDRGQVLPVLHPSEAVAIGVGAGLVLRLLVFGRIGLRGQLAARLNRVDGAIVLLAITGSALPLLWMTIRGRHISHDDLLFALVLWKFYAIFLIVRVSVRTERQVARCLWLILFASALMALIGILQSLDVGGVTAFLAKHYSPLSQGAAGLTSGRASSTLASSFSVADVATYCLAIAGAWLMRGNRHRLVLAGMAALFVLATMASGEFSALIGLVVGAFAFGILMDRFGRTLFASVAAGLTGLIVLQPVVQARLADTNASSGLPSSWADRLHNLQTFFWPTLGSDLNWLTGVQPTAQVRDIHRRFGFVWIESGHTWLLWTGGVAMLLAFFIFLAVTMAAVARVARRRSDAVGVAAVASFITLTVVAVLMTFDPHLTLRGAADLSFSLLALALIAEPARGSHVIRRAHEKAP